MTWFGAGAAGLVFWAVPCARSAVPAARATAAASTAAVTRVFDIRFSLINAIRLSIPFGILSVSAQIIGRLESGQIERMSAARARRYKPRLRETADRLPTARK